MVKVTFRYKDYAHENQQRTMIVPATSSCAASVHVLPDGSCGSGTRLFGESPWTRKAGHLPSLARRCSAPRSAGRQGRTGGRTVRRRRRHGRSIRCPACKTGRMRIIDTFGHLPRACHRSIGAAAHVVSRLGREGSRWAASATQVERFLLRRRRAVHIAGTVMRPAADAGLRRASIPIASQAASGQTTEIAAASTIISVRWRTSRRRAATIESHGPRLVAVPVQSIVNGAASGSAGRPTADSAPLQLLVLCHDRRRRGRRSRLARD